MGKATKSKFYAIRRGFKTGIFTMPWDETKKLVEGYKGAVFKGFKSLKEAEEYMKSMGSDRISNPSLFISSNHVSLERESGTVITDNTSAIAVSVNPDLAVVDETEESALEAIPKPLIVYTDGSCLGNGRSEPKAGYGVYFGPNDSRNESNRVPGPQTNNRGELLGVIRALELTKDSMEKVIIRSDSQYVRNGLQSWMPRWKRNGWKRSTGELLNVDFWKTLDLLYSDRARRGMVRIEYVKAHSGHEGNEGADKLANAGALMESVNK